MPDEYDDLEADDMDGDGESGVIRDLRSRLKKAEAKAAETDGLRKELALARAGLDLNEKQAKALLATYEGEWTSDGLQAHAAELGFAQTDAPAEDPQVPADEQAAHARSREAMANAEAAEAHPQTLEDRIATAKSEEEVLALVGEAGMLYDPEAPNVS